MYNKLFTKILDSSIWLQPSPTRIVWLTFIAVMDESGFVQFASVANVAHRARVTPEEAQAAVEHLEGPDPDSSDPEYDGRRVERVPGGWMVLNAEKHREMVTKATIQAQTRERVRRHREIKRTCNATVTHGDNEAAHDTLDSRVATQDLTESRVESSPPPLTTVVTGAVLQPEYTTRGGVQTTDHTCNATVTPSEADTDTEADTEEEEQGKGALGADAPPSPTDLMGLWNTLTTPPIPKCRALSKMRSLRARCRLAERPLAEWREVVERINASRFCRGESDRGTWVATFDWLLQPDTALRVLEGKYDNRAPCARLGAGKTSGNAAALAAYAETLHVD
jgi:hypothetical protein